MGRRLAAPMLLLAMLLGVFAMAGTVAADTNYTCPDSSCAFTVPDSYTEASNDPTQIIFQDPNSGGVFSVAVTDGSTYGSLDDAVNDIDSQNQGKSSYQPGPSNRTNTVVGGNPATLIEYTANNSNGLLVETANFISIYHGKLYQLIFVTTPDQEDTFVTGAKPVFDSWQFT